jgi:hypothetical protein
MSKTTTTDVQLDIFTFIAAAVPSPAFLRNEAIQQFLQSAPCTPVCGRKVHRLAHLMTARRPWSLCCNGRRKYSRVGALL